MLDIAIAALLLIRLVPVLLVVPVAVKLAQSLCASAPLNQMTLPSRDSAVHPQRCHAMSFSEASVGHDVRSQRGDIT